MQREEEEEEVVSGCEGCKVEDEEVDGTVREIEGGTSGVSLEVEEEDDEVGRRGTET